MAFATALAAFVLTATSASAQITGVVEIRDGYGRAMVRNASRREISVEVALWESDETGPQVELLRPARANLWPIEFRLLPGETQFVRISVPESAYPPDTLLRLESLFTPVLAEQPAPPSDSAADGARARLVMVTRIISKVWIR